MFSSTRRNMRVTDHGPLASVPGAARGVGAALFYWRD